MIYRPIFVTNSSSSCTVVYGIQIDEQQLDKFLRILYRKNQKKAEAFVKRIRKDKQEELAFDPENDFVEIIKGDFWGANGIMPKNVALAYGEGYSYGEGCDDYWIDFKPSMDGEVKDGQVVLKNLKAEDVTAIVDMAKEAGVTDTTLRLDYWESLE